MVEFVQSVKLVVQSERPIVGTVFDVLHNILFFPIIFVDINERNFVPHAEIDNFLSFWIYFRLIIGGIWLYFISCVLISIYNKFKPRSGA